MEQRSNKVKAPSKDVSFLKKARKHLFTIFIMLPGILFLFLGFQWLVAPEDAAAALMMPLLNGAGLNSQIGDIGGLFLGMGLLVMGAVTTKKSDLLLSVSVLLSCIATYRLISFALCDATLIVQMFVVETVIAIWYLVASKKMNEREQKNA
ncbi:MULTISPECIES: DUF4345 family protein [unclassified Fusibacter]|uniref:DUF4345 family protein n=1 Tax=unclassified Fusibacter TaxID=2624464 RepID=UPI00101064C7|nr:MULTISPECIES: hypothetical protein [unclassified Fusibacter]MCK8061698.1 hypothetical protein [Fusibacter sp. A2]NPE23867.1 hypothetical protein [Fusibacter sp. A1]RXV58542.1 hypothetical protein DWB64_18950 [Fusibacter sp. A1]